MKRDPSVFQIVLNFMRGNPPKLSSLPPSQIEQLRDDALVLLYFYFY